MSLKSRGTGTLSEKSELVISPPASPASPGSSNVLMRRLRKAFSRFVNGESVVDASEDCSKTMKSDPQPVQQKSLSSIEATPIPERTMDEHLIHCIHRAKNDLFSHDPATALYHMGKNLLSHPAFSQESWEPQFCTETLIRLGGKPPAEQGELTLAFLNGFAVAKIS